MFHFKKQYLLSGWMKGSDTSPPVSGTSIFIQYFCQLLIPGGLCFCLYCSPPSPPCPLDSWHRAAGTCLRCAPSTRRPGKCMWEKHYVGQVETLLSSFNSSHLKLQMTGGRGRMSLQWPLLAVGWSQFLDRSAAGRGNSFVRSDSSWTDAQHWFLSQRYIFVCCPHKDTFIYFCSSATSWAQKNPNRADTCTGKHTIIWQMLEPPTLLSYYLACSEKVRYVCLSATTGLLIHWDSSLWKVQIWFRSLLQLLDWSGGQT